MNPIQPQKVWSAITLSALLDQESAHDLSSQENSHCKKSLFTITSITNPNGDYKIPISTEQESNSRNNKMMCENTVGVNSQLIPNSRNSHHFKGRWYIREAPRHKKVNSQNSTKKNDDHFQNEVSRSKIHHRHQILPNVPINGSDMTFSRSKCDNQESTIDHSSCSTLSHDEIFDDKCSVRKMFSHLNCKCRECCANSTKNCQDSSVKFRCRQNCNFNSHINTQETEDNHCHSHKMRYQNTGSNCDKKFRKSDSNYSKFDECCMMHNDCHHNHRLQDQTYSLMNPLISRLNEVLDLSTRVHTKMIKLITDDAMRTRGYFSEIISDNSRLFYQNKHYKHIIKTLNPRKINNFRDLPHCHHHSSQETPHSHRHHTSKNQDSRIQSPITEIDYESCCECPVSENGHKSSNNQSIASLHEAKSNHSHLKTESNQICISCNSSKSPEILPTTSTNPKPKLNDETHPSFHHLSNTLCSNVFTSSTSPISELCETPCGSCSGVGSQISTKPNEQNTSTDVSSTANVTLEPADDSVGKGNGQISSESLKCAQPCGNTVKKGRFEVYVHSS